MRASALAVTLAAAVTACVPSRRDVFAPVSDAVDVRLGERPSWQTDWQPSAASQKRNSPDIGAVR